MKRISLLLLPALLLTASPSSADFEGDAFENFQWREVGPYRGGRSAAVAGIPERRDTYYFGSTGGGVWKTTDAGRNWTNVSDGFFGGSIGAVAVSEWDPNVIYVGTGEKTVRGNVSHGDGMWKSVDAGRSWTRIGLEDSRHIPRVRIHPRNPDLVYAAVLGHLYGPSEQRGIYRTRDGGSSWERVLYVGDEVGAVDLVMDPTNPRILYASLWRVKRTPYSLESGGEGSGLWKSVDGGDSWTELTGNEGLPNAPIGISGVSVSASDPDSVYAIIEAAEGGVFRSHDGGETWTRVNSERKLRQRAWYYSRIEADPVDADTVYVLNVRFHRSRDGGRTFVQVPTPHGDNHDLWIDPRDPLRMVQANDGGANVSEDGGETWTTQANQPTAQMYRVSVDDDFPYRLLGGQQDNSAIRIRSRSSERGAIGVRDWDPTAGGESGHIVAEPGNPDVVYGGSYGGYLVRYDHATGERRAVNVWPDNPMGWGAAELKYRFNWNFPLLFSRHEPGTLYAAANVLFKTSNGGQSWEAISGDLTRDIEDKQGPSGGPITKDNTSVEYYGTIFAVAESATEPGVIWTGSDDGLLHVTRDGGENWTDVTPPRMPREIQINSLEPHPTEAGGLYLAATAYKSDDFRPYLFRTLDYGRSWTRITDGIAENHFTRVVRADPARPGLLFAGTESGLYASFDDGRNWRRFQLNLPLTPITDLAIKDGDLIAATQGRGYWILDDLSPLREWEDGLTERALHLFTPRPAYRLSAGYDPDPTHMGQNPPDGVVLRFWLAAAPADDAEVRLEITDDGGERLRTLSRKPDASPGAEQPDKADADAVLEPRQGMNQATWDFRLAPAEEFPGMVLWNSSLDGPKVPPGRYTATLVVGDERQSVDFEVVPDPRTSATAEDFALQYEFRRGVRDKISETHEAIAEIRELQAAIEGLNGRLAGDDERAALLAEGEKLLESLTGIEETLYQTKMEARQDPLNFPIRLNDKLAGVYGLSGIGDHRPTASMIAVRDELTAAIDSELARFAKLKDEDIPAFNELARGLEVGVLAVD